jgi:hypothetical protein
MQRDGNLSRIHPDKNRERRFYPDDGTRNAPEQRHSVQPWKPLLNSKSENNVWADTRSLHCWCADGRQQSVPGAPLNLQSDHSNLAVNPDLTDLGA